MKKLTAALLALCCLAFFSAAPRANASDEGQYDVVIYGGTSAAVTCAVQVKKMGKSVVIVSPDSRLGGLSSGGLGHTDSGNRAVVGGLAREFYHRLWLYYQREDAWTVQPMPRENGRLSPNVRGNDNQTQTMWAFEPSAAEKTFEAFIDEYEIPVCRAERLDREKGVKKSGVKIESITTLSNKTFRGKTFIDAAYEGDLMAAAGVGYRTGREANSEYGETLDGIQVKHAIYHQFEGFVDPYVEKGKPESGLLPRINEKLNGQDGDGDALIQAYNIRMCLTNDPKNMVKIEKPENYDPLDYEILIRSIEAGQKVFMSFTSMPNYKTDSNNDLAVSTDYIGGNYDYPDASYARRDEIYEQHRAWQQGLLWTLQNDPRVPENIRAEISKWGLAKDEFAENGNWSPQLYVREARRMKSDFVVSERHLRYLDKTARSVGMGSYNMDSHHCQRYVAVDEEGRATVRNEGDVEVNPGAPYPIDYGAIVPKKNECDNLLVPVCVSCTHIAFGSIRMEPVFMILGQSAGTAACLAQDAGVSPQELDYAVLRKRLLDDGQVLEYGVERPSVPAEKLTGVVIDDKDAQVKGPWSSNNVCSKFVDSDYLHDDNADKDGKSVSFPFKGLKPGRYECRISYPPHANRATNVPVTAKSSKGEIQIEVNQKSAPEIDALFTKIGELEVGEDGELTVTVDAKGSNGYVTVDAAQLIPLE